MLVVEKKMIEFVGKFDYIVQSHEECYYKDYCKNV